MKKTLFDCTRCFFVLIFAFTIGMLLVYLIPNSALKPQYTKSIEQAGQEEPYASFLFNSDASILDNYTDLLMLETCHVSHVYTNPLQSALDNNGYPRYWNGYLLTLRPILSQFSYQQIRYINMFILITAFCFCFSGIHRELSWVTALGFAVSVIMCFLVFISESLQYFSVFMILFAEMLLILYIPSLQTLERSVVLFFASGMVTNFFDLLTAPLLTLGIPLALIICLTEKNDPEADLSGSLRRIISHSIAWGAGYALCWAAKWTLGTLILQENLFSDAMTTAKFRVEGNEAYPLDRALMFRKNIETYFFAKGHKPFALISLVSLILIICLIRSHRRDWIQRIIPLLLIAFFPYIWYFVFANHSQLHYLYTYRIQAITMFAVFAAIGNALSVYPPHPNTACSRSRC